MTVTTENTTTMLYCPKCRRTYEEGTQRFCDNDGGRLLPAPSAQKADSQANGVFTNLLGKLPQNEQENKPKPAPRFIPFNKTEESDKKLTSFPSVGRIFQSENFLKPESTEKIEIDEQILELEKSSPEIEEDSILELDLPTPLIETKIEPQKPLPRIIKQSEVPSGTALIGDRRINPAGREALSWENTDALLGQTVKGRYNVVELLEEDDENSILYFAEDKIVPGKKVIVRVFMDGDLDSIDLSAKILAEERVSLSHLKHPNIAGVFDSGKLLEGNEFIVSEYVEGKSLRETLKETGQFNALRTARIIRQTSYALSEAHQNGILHRTLKPENIFLTVSEAGIEQVKLMNFGVSDGTITDDNLAYKAPEEIDNGITTFASDIYALGVIAYQMLTARLPFNERKERDLLKAQRAGLTLLPTNLRLDLSPLTDKILAKAVAFNPSERYPKARDFGDAFFNALSTVAPWSDDEKAEVKGEIPAQQEIAKPHEFIVVPAINLKEIEAADALIDADIHIAKKADSDDEEMPIAEAKSTEILPWEKRSPELPKTGNSIGNWLAILGFCLLLLAFWGVWRFFLNRPTQPEVTQTQSIPVSKAEVTATETPQDLSLTSGDPDIAPEPRNQKQPANTEHFQNNRNSLKGDLAKNFLGFDLYYPTDWTKADTQTNFLDISKRGANNLPIEQMIVTRYESRGTMTLDKPNFPKLVEKSNQDLKASLGDGFKVVSEGETTIQDGRWKAYEVKFQSASITGKGDGVTIWGRRLWIPVQRGGVRSGFVITMLATSLSDAVKSADEVGVNGELADILQSFEPEPTF